MAKFLIKLQAIELRETGQSIKDIAKYLGISQSTASVWCRHIKLTHAQILKLLKTKEKNITAGRLKGALIQKMKRINAIKKAEEEALKINKLSDNEFFFIGLALYLAEGSKTMGTVQFTNGDLRLIKFMLSWFKKFYNIPKNEMKYTVTINAIHKTRDKKVKNFWQKRLGLKPELFTNTRFVITKSKKTYTNAKNYFGTFSFRINKSTNLLYKLNALMNRMLAISK